MNDAESKSIIKNYIVNEFMHGSPEVELTDDFPLIERGAISSISIFKLIAFLEERFSVNIDTNEVMLENFESIGSINSLLRAKMPKE